MSEQDSITVFVCGKKTCEHEWHGPIYESEDGLTCSATCSKCGEIAFNMSMWEGE